MGFQGCFMGFQEVSGAILGDFSGVPGVSCVFQGVSVAFQFQCFLIGTFQGSQGRLKDLPGFFRGISVDFRKFKGVSS